MTADQTKIALLDERVGRHRKDLGRAFAHIDALEEKRVKDDLDRVKNDGRMEEMGASINSLGHSVENVVTEFREATSMMGEVGARLKAIEETLENELIPIKNRIARIEEKEVDVVMVIKWLGTWRGTFFMCFVFSITVGVLVPDAREFILDVFGIATQAKG